MHAYGYLLQIECDHFDQEGEYYEGKEDEEDDEDEREEVEEEGYVVELDGILYNVCEYFLTFVQ